ncbi:hypothetical protein BGW39_008453 [Mortierella sp. 14UC]|nr:hypothetical protein BGW39_008453 [Mortierella sp. 14UC]
MVKSVILLGFALAPAAPSSFIRTRCYSVDAGLGIRSGEYINGDSAKSKFSVTMYTGPACNGQYDRRSFTRTDSHPYGWDHLTVTTENLRSFKVDPFHTSNVSGGYAGLDPEYTVPSGCRRA